jgi:hypothetical protein
MKTVANEVGQNSVAINQQWGIDYRQFQSPFLESLLPWIAAFDPGQDPNHQEIPFRKPIEGLPSIPI